MTHLRKETEHIYASLASNQTTSLTNNDPVLWDTVDSSHGGSIALDTTTNVGRFTLKAGRRYRLQAQVRNTYSDSSGNGQYGWYDVTNSTALGRYSSGSTNPDPTPESEVSLACTVVVPSTNIEIELRRITGNNILSIDSLYAWAIIEVF